MKVLFVISSLNTGGAQRALSNLVTGLPGDWEIDILLNNTGNIIYPYKGNLIDLELKEASDRNSIFYQLKVLVRRITMLRRLKRNNSYSACVSFLESANIANLLTGNKYCKVIVSVRNNLSHKKTFVHKCLNIAVKHMYNRADSVVALSKGVENDLVRNLGVQKNKAITIYNGFHIEDIQKRALTQSVNLPPTEATRAFTFITAGRCEQQKGQWHLLRAFAHFAKKHDRCRLIILGDGPYIPYFKQLVSEYGIDESVVLKGFVDNPYAEYSKADVFVFPSLFEGFGNVTLESMICALPVISSDYRYGAREILSPATDIEFEQTSKIELADYGIITPVCSGVRHSADVPLEPAEQLLLEAMEIMYTDTQLRNRYREASQKRAQDFSINNCVKQWCDITKKV